MVRAEQRRSPSQTGALALLAALTLLTLFYGRRPAADRAAPSVPVESNDRRIEDAVQRALLVHGVRVRELVDVYAIDGAVHLSGRVHTERDRLALLLAAGSAPGVRVLVDDLRVGGEE